MVRIAMSVVVLCALLASCASTPPATPPPERLFDDRLFEPASVRIDARDVLAMSDDMKRYSDAHIAGRIRIAGRREALLEALYSAQQLRLEYDSEMTRSAAEAFAARAGNCLSLAIMTGAFAREIDVPVRYQIVYVDDTWSRSGDIQFFSAHVNVALGRNMIDVHSGRHEADRVTVDFLPSSETRGLRTREVGEATIVAMYMNNKAAEALAQRRLDDAYWWSRAAIAQDPAMVSAYNTLGVVYQRHGDLAQAESALRYALAREPSSVHAMSNLAVVLTAQNRLAEADALTRTLEKLEPNPPFAYFHRGVTAMRRHDFARARALFAEEVDRAPSYDEFRFWLAAAYVGLGDLGQAREQLELAIEYSTNRRSRDVYAAKLAKINAAH